MNRRKTFDKINIALDLTSLLDVIFIVLMVVMCSSHNNVNEMAEVQSELEEARSTIEMYEAHEDDIENLSERVVFLTIRADFDAEDPTHRTVKIMTGDDLKGAEEIDITAEDEDVKYSEIKDKVSSVLAGVTRTDGDVPETIPVWVTLSDENILYRDWMYFDEMLGELKDSYPNLYVYDRLMEQ